jgi:hypothetical protein
MLQFQETNVIKKDAEKIPKYKYLTTEIQHMRNLKTNVIPVITGATGTITKFRKYLSFIPRKHEIKELQKTAILGTAHILGKVLMQKYNTVDLTFVICTINSN